MGFYNISKCPIQPQKTCVNAIKGKCSFGITQPEKCPLIMADRVANKNL